MSNTHLKEKISEAITLFEQGRSSFVSLIESIENAGSAVEAIPYEMVVELRGIVSRLAIEQGYEEEDCVSNPTVALAHLKEWLKHVPD
jgi:hypothetical protein